MVKQTDGLGRVTTFTYDAAGRRTSLTDAQGNTHGFVYDGSGLLCERHYQGVKKQSISRDVQNRRVEVTDYQGSAATTHTLTYNRLGSLIQHEGPERTLTYSYNKDSQRTALSFEGVREEYSYTSGGLLAGITRTTKDSTGGVVSAPVEAVRYTYDSTGRLVAIVDQDEHILYQTQVLPTAVEDEQNPDQLITDGGYAQVIQRKHPTTGNLVETTTYYNQDGLLIGTEDHVDGLRLYSYDEAHLLTSIQSNAGTQIFTYDEAGYLIRETQTDGTVRTYSYDEADQLTVVEASTGERIEYVYDGLGRRIRETNNTGTTREYAFDELDQLIGYTRTGQNPTGEDQAELRVSLSYDPLGQLASIAGVPVVFDTADTLLPVTLGMGGTLVPLATRVAGLNLTGERGVDAFGLSQAVFTPDTETITTAGAAGVGQVAELDTRILEQTEADQETANPTTGTVAHQIPGEPDLEALLGVNLGLGASTGILIDDLEILGARVYDPATRGFLSTDPLASPLGAGWSGNVYAFAGLNPVGLVDPWGLSPMDAAAFREYRANTTERISEKIGNFVDQHAGAIAAGVAIVGVAALAVSGPIGWGILSGMAVSGGIELASQAIGIGWNKAFGDGSKKWTDFDMKKVYKSAALGGIGGGVASGATAVVGKVGAKIFSSRATTLFSQADDFAPEIKVAFKMRTNPATKQEGLKLVGSLGKQQQAIKGAAQKWATRADTFGNAEKFFSSSAGKAVNNFASGSVGNVMNYATSPGPHTVGGYVQSASVGGVTNMVNP